MSRSRRLPNKALLPTAGLRLLRVLPSGPAVAELDRWTTMKIRHPSISAVCLAIALTACRHTNPERSAHAGSSSSPGKTGSADYTMAVVELARGHDSVHGRWRVVVSAEDASLHLSRLSGTGSTTISPEHWKAAEGAFVFIEGDHRLWTYDGVHDLSMWAATADTTIVYGPRHFPCRLPDEVASRLPAKIRDEIRGL